MQVYYPVAKAFLYVIFDGFGDSAKDSKSYIIPTLPKAVTVHRNSYKQADSWELTFDAGDLPIDPQQIRYGAVEIFLMSLPGLQNDQRIESRQFAASDDPARLPGNDAIENLRREKKAAIAKYTTDNPPMISGIFDEDSLEMSASGKWVTISGQDYTAFLAAKQWPPTASHTAKRIPTGKRLDLQIKGILAEADTDGRLTLVTPGIPKTTAGIPDLPIVGSKEPNSHKHGIHVQESTSYWDVMYGLAIRHGYILFVQGNNVVLTTPKNADARTVQPKKLAWGKNLESIHMSRKMGKEKVPRIIVQGYDPKTREIVRGEYPNTGLGRHLKSNIGNVGFKPSSKVKSIDKTSTAGAKGHPKKAAPLKLEDEFEIIPATSLGINWADSESLQRAAEALYHLRGHAERKMVVTTRDLRDMNDASMMDLSAGDAVEVEWMDFNREMIVDPAVPEQRKYEYLIAKGLNDEVARVIAQNYTLLLGQKRPMRVREVSYEYDVDSGVSIELELQDFVAIDDQRGDGAEPALKDRRLDQVRTEDGERIGNSQIDGGGG